MSANLSEHVESTGQRAQDAVERRLIDQWFPCPAVDEAVTTPAGSGRSEKALFTWFASRPIAQARAAVLTTLLPDNSRLRALSMDRPQDVHLEDCGLTTRRRQSQELAA